MKKKICVLLDTNIWVYSTKMLRSPLGSALLYLIRKNQIKIILPEVVEMEIRKHILKHGIDNVEKIEKGYSVIEKLIGERDNFDLPNKEDFINAADERFFASY
jgi:predicted nucleic acid-binding protein